MAIYLAHILIIQASCLTAEPQSSRPDASQAVIPNPAGLVTEVWFEGYRVVLRSTDETAIMAWSPPAAPAPVADAAAGPTGEGLLAEHVTGFAGVTWGTGVDNAVVQWFDQLKTPDDRWRKAGNAPFIFSKRTEMIGRAKEFSWQAVTASGLTVRRPDDREGQAEFWWTAMHQLDDVFLCSTDPAKAFEALAVRGKQGAIERTEEQREGEVIRRAAVNFGDPVVHTNALWTTHAVDAAGVESLTGWAFLQIDHRLGRTYLYHISVFGRTDSKRVLPSKPEEIPGAHQDVADIDSLIVTDYTNLGRWKRPNVVEPDRSAVDDALSAIRAQPGSIAIRGALLAVFVTFFFIQHLRSRK